MVKSNNEIGKVNDKKNMIQKSNNEIRKFWNRKKSTYRWTVYLIFAWVTL